MMNRYYDDYRLVSFTDEIADIKEENGKYWVITANSCFFVEGGGMTKDEGTLNGSKVLDVKFEDQKYWHLTEEKPEGMVEGKVDFSKRLRKAQVHTAQHLISAYLENTYQLKTLSHHVSLEDNDIEFSGRENEVDVKRLQEELNSYLVADLPVSIEYPTEQEARLSVSKDDLQYEELRVVKIGDLDYNLCGCIHVNHLAEIGLIFIKEWEKTKTGGIVHYLAGQQLLDYLRPRYQQLNQATKLLALEHLKIVSGIERLQQENKELSYRLSELKREKLERLADEYLGSDCPLVMETDDLEVKEGQYFIRYLANQGFAFVVALVLKLTGNRCHVLISGSQAQDIFNELAEIYDLKGGGNEKLCQGGGPYNQELIDRLKEKLV